MATRMFRKKSKVVITILALAVFLLLAAVSTSAAPFPIPQIQIGVGEARGASDIAQSLQLLMILTVLSLSPGILMMTTSFVRIVIVLSFTRSAMGTGQMPPSQLMIGLALFLTFFTMLPTWTQVNDQALQPMLRGELQQEEAFTIAAQPIREFMFRYTRSADLKLFVDAAKIPNPTKKEDVPTQVLIPAFIISELKTAFMLGFMIYIPFLIIDMVVASTLMSMGMMMLPPVMISLPFKILLFILVDGWHLLARSLILSFS